MTDYSAATALKPNINPSPARGMFGGPVGSYEVNPTMIGGVNPTVQKFRITLTVMGVVYKRGYLLHDSVGTDDTPRGNTKYRQKEKHTVHTAIMWICDRFTRAISQLGVKVMTM